MDSVSPHPKKLKKEEDMSYPIHTLHSLSELVDSTKSIAHSAENGQAEEHGLYLVVTYEVISNIHSVSNSSFHIGCFVSLTYRSYAARVAYCVSTSVYRMRANFI
jgi:hypothetical protein